LIAVPALANLDVLPTSGSSLVEDGQSIFLIRLWEVVARAFSPFDRGGAILGLRPRLG
jgi:hypothetical protein